MSLNENRKVNWELDAFTETKLFSLFTQELISKMGNEDVTYHYHEWSISLETYLNSTHFSSVMKLISTDTVDGKKIVTSFEGRKYPFYGVIYHPEFAYLNVHSEDHGL